MSLYDELTEKLTRDPRLTKKGGPRVDLSLLLFNARADVHALWLAAEGEVARAKSEGRPVPEVLAAAVEQLKPIFGPR
jgi:hypothetical protein